MNQNKNCVRLFIVRDVPVFEDIDGVGSSLATAAARNRFLVPACAVVFSAQL